MVNIPRKTDGKISKTMAFNGGSLIASAILTAVLAELPQLQDTIPAWLYGIIMMAGSAANIYLRSKTELPLRND